MGNAPSVEANRRSAHKLSKPRTSNHAAAGLLSPNGFIGSKARFSNARLSNQFLPDPPAPSPTTSTSPRFEEPVEDSELPAEQEPTAMARRKESKRRSLFRSLSSQGSVTKAHRRNSTIATSSPRVGEKPTRAMSMTHESSYNNPYHGRHAPEHWSVAGSRMSWNYDMSSYEAKRLLNLDEEPGFQQTTVVSEIKTTVVAETVWKTSNPTTSQPPSVTISRANSDLSLYTPVRRRSLIQTPGVATRTWTNAGSSKATFRYSQPPTPNLSRHQSFESMRGGVISMPPRIMDAEFVPRVVTPIETDYGSIGAFKLGSLRITNGAASPVSPEMRKPEKPESEEELGRVDYFTATQSLAPIDGSLGITASSSPSTLQIASPQPRSLLSPITATYRQVEKDKTLPSLPVNYGTFKMTDSSPPFLAEISFAPFSLLDSRPASPELQTTSKHTALEDQLFEDDVPLEFSAVEKLDIRLDPNAKSQTLAVTENIQVVSSVKIVARTDSGFASTSSPSSEISHMALTKADSGYSSNVSLRSFRNSKLQVSVKDEALSLTKSPSGSMQGGESQPQSPVVASGRGFAAASRSESSRPPVPPKDSLPKSPSSASGSSVRQALSVNTRPKETRLDSLRSAKGSRHPPSPINSFRSFGPGSKSPDSVPHTPTSPNSDSSTSALSIGGGSYKPTKLQRLLSVSGARRSTNGPPTVHATHAVDKTVIPSIPQHVETRLQEHTGLFPLAYKRLAIKPQQSKDTLKTIFSVGSLEMNFEPVPGMNSVTPVSEQSPEASPAAIEDSHRKHGFQAVSASIVNAASHVIPRKSITRKAVATRAISVKTDDIGAASSSPVSTKEANTPEIAITDAVGDATFKAMATERNLYFSPTGAGIVAAETGRTMSLMSHPDRMLLAQKVPYRSKSSTSLSKQRSLELLPPKKTATPPPVSMVTRAQLTLRTPPQLRNHAGSTDQALSRKTSRESIHSYPSSAVPTLARKTSRESVQSYPSYQQQFSTASVPPQPIVSPPPVPPQNPRRSLTMQRSHSSLSIQRQDWEVQTSYDSSSPRRTGNPLSPTSASDYGSGIQRPASAQPYTGRPIPLRHRSSYDGLAQRGSLKPRGHPPSMSNGYTAPSQQQPYDPWSDPNANLALHQWESSGPYPRHNGKGHYRHRSMGNKNGYGAPRPPPYRVLHSYNSPAYRNVPIWG